MKWGNFYDVAVQDLEIQPSEFWAMCPQEFWRLFDRKVRTQKEIKSGMNGGMKKACDLSEEEKQAALQVLKDYRQKHGQK